MQSIAVVKHQYVIQDVLLRLVSGLVISPIYPLILQAAEDTFCNGVVPAITFSAHAVFKTELFRPKNGTNFPYKVERSMSNSKQ